MEPSSVYMCFPCYQEFDTLEEVLKHQLTCTAEEDQLGPPGNTSVNVPVLQTQQHVLNISKAVSQDDAQQTEHLEGQSSEQLHESELKQLEEDDKQPSDQPRILYQCGDCDELFKSLDLWQQHRREGTCQQLTSDSKPRPESLAEPEISSDAALNPDETSFSQVETTFQLKPETEDRPIEDAEFAQTSSSQSPDVPVAELISSASNQEELSPRRRATSKKQKPESVLLCVDCGSCFGLVSELVSHRKTQHGFEEALHRCSVCGESFLNTTLFLYHRKQHRQKGEEKVAARPEMTTREVYNQANGVVERFVAASSKFSQPDLFFCAQCGQSFCDEAGFVAHRKETHGLNEPLHTCSHCKQGFMNSTQFLYHWRLHHVAEMATLNDEAEIDDEATPQHKDSAQGTKRRLSSSGESSSPADKRSRPSFSTLSAKALKGKKGSGGGEGDGGCVADSESIHQPPPVKLLQDWARTPLPHVCPYCGKTFTRRVFLRSHVYSHTGEKLFTCKVCTKAFTNSQSLLRHSMNHTGNKPFYCEVCGKNFSQAATLKRHQLIHTTLISQRKRGRKPVFALDSEGAAHLFACPNCPSRFNTEDQLNHHRLLHTSHPFPCSDCGEAFKRRKDLDLHSLTHQDKHPVSCPHCSSQFVNQSVLEIHLQRCPTTDEEKNAGRGRGQGRGRCTGQIECDLCGHRCMTQEGLDLHRLSHTGQTPLKCPVRPCRRRFTSNATLEEHVLAHFQGRLGKSKTRGRFRCEICLKEFAYNSTFSVHMRTHTDERPFECTTCGKRFRQLPHLQDHERIHSGLRPFCCWICGKSFSVAARLTEHARTHSGEKPYPCPHCSAAFRSRPNLDKHIRLHGDVPQEDTEQVVQAAEAAHVQKVLEGAKVLSSLANVSEVEAGAVQTIYVLQGAEGTTETVMIPSDQLEGIDGASQVVILPSSVLGTQTIAVPTITVGENEITMVETDDSTQHAIEFIVEETV